MLHEILRETGNPRRRVILWSGMIKLYQETLIPMIHETQRRRRDASHENCTGAAEPQERRDDEEEKSDAFVQQVLEQLGLVDAGDPTPKGEEGSFQAPRVRFDGIDSSIGDQESSGEEVDPGAASDDAFGGEATDGQQMLSRFVQASKIGDHRAWVDALFADVQHDGLRHELRDDALRNVMRAKRDDEDAAGGIQAILAAQGDSVSVVADLDRRRGLGPPTDRTVNEPSASPLPAINTLDFIRQLDADLNEAKASVLLQAHHQHCPHCGLTNVIGDTNLESKLRDTIRQLQSTRCFGYVVPGTRFENNGRPPPATTGHPSTRRSPDDPDPSVVPPQSPLTAALSPAASARFLRAEDSSPVTLQLPAPAAKKPRPRSAIPTADTSVDDLAMLVLGAEYAHPPNVSSSLFHGLDAAMWQAVALGADVTEGNALSGALWLEESVAPGLLQTSTALKREFESILSGHHWKSVLSETAQQWESEGRSVATQQVALSKRITVTQNELAAAKADLNAITTQLDSLHADARMAIETLFRLETKVHDVSQKEAFLRQAISTAHANRARRRAELHTVQDFLSSVSDQRAQLHRIAALLASHLKQAKTVAAMVPDALERTPLRVSVPQPPDDAKATIWGAPCACCGFYTGTFLYCPETGDAHPPCLFHKEILPLSAGRHPIVTKQTRTDARGRFAFVPKFTDVSSLQAFFFGAGLKAGPGTFHRRLSRQASSSDLSRSTNYFALGDHSARIDALLAQLGGNDDLLTAASANRAATEAPSIPGVGAADEDEGKHRTWRQKQRDKKRQKETAAAKAAAAELQAATEAQKVADGHANAAAVGPLHHATAPPHMYLEATLRSLMLIPSAEEIAQLNSLRDGTHPTMATAESLLRDMLSHVKPVFRQGLDFLLPEGLKIGNLTEAQVEERILLHEIDVMTQVLKRAHVPVRELLQQASELDREHHMLDVKLRNAAESVGQLKQAAKASKRAAAAAVQYQARAIGPHPPPRMTPPHGEPLHLPNRVPTPQFLGAPPHKV